MAQAQTPSRSSEGSKQPEIKAVSAPLEAAQEGAEKAADNWKRLFDEQYSQVARWQNYGAEQARMALDQSFKLIGDATAYALQYSSDWQRIAFDWSRRAAQLLVPAA